jgi:hypothetical protein
MRRLCIGISIALGIYFGATAEFTEKRNKKNPSISLLKEECCEQFGELLKTVPSLLQSVAQVQTEAVNIIQGFWESDKQSWCEKASRQKLTVCNERLQALQAKINAVLEECQQTLKEVRS